MATSVFTVLTTANVHIQTESFVRNDTKQHREDVSLSLLSNAVLNCSYTRDGTLAYSLPLVDCESISISISTNNTICIEFKIIILHLIFPKRSLIDTWYDKMVEVLNGLGYDFPTKIDPNCRRRRVASQRKVRPRTSVRKEKGKSDLPNPNGYAEGTCVASERIYYDILPNPGTEENQNLTEYTSNNGAPLYNTYLISEIKVPPPVPRRPPKSHKAQSIPNIDRVANADRFEPIVSVDRAEPIASVDRIEPIASVDIMEPIENVNKIKSGDEIDEPIKNKNTYRSVDVNCECDGSNLEEKECNKSTAQQEEYANNFRFRKRANDILKKPINILTKETENVASDYKKKATKHLHRQLKRTMRIQINKKELEENIVLTMVSEGVHKGVLFIAWLKGQSLYGILYEGDMIVTISNQRIDSVQDAMNIIRKADKDPVELEIIRLPYAEIVPIQRQSAKSDLGFTLDKRKVNSVDKDGLADIAGLRTQTMKATRCGSLTRTCVTAINSIPLAHHCNKQQTLELLSLNSDVVSLVVQPLDLIAHFQNAVDSSET